MSPCPAQVNEFSLPHSRLSWSLANIFTEGPGELLLKLNVTGLCYSDIHYMLEDLPLPRMGHYGVCSPGHEGAGVVAAVGSNVAGWKVGDRAGVAPTWDTCMACELCASDMECHCPEAIPTGLKVPGKFAFLELGDVVVL